MSDWKGHLKTGFVFQIITLLIIVGAYIYLKKMPTILELCLIIPIFIISPLFPDVDHPSSKITKFFYLIGVISLWSGFYFLKQYMLYSIIFLSMITITSQFISHRGVTHRWWFILLIHVGIAVVTQQYALSALSLSGMISHLVADKTY